MIRLTRIQVREIDRRSIEQYHIPGIVLMENAGRAVAEVACKMLGRPTGKQVVVLCGGGNNGGDGLVAARHLHNRGLGIRILSTEFGASPSQELVTNMGIVLMMKLPTAHATHRRVRQAKCDLVIDALLGTGLSTAPRVAMGEVIDVLNTTGRPVLAVDLPSGMDCDTGEPLGACVRATRTVTFVAEKIGFANPASRQYTGQVTVADIGCPRELIEEIARTSV